MLADMIRVHEQWLLLWVRSAIVVIIKGVRHVTGGEARRLLQSRLGLLVV